MCSKNWRITADTSKRKTKSNNDHFKKYLPGKEGDPCAVFWWCHVGMKWTRRRDQWRRSSPGWRLVVSIDAMGCLYPAPAEPLDRRERQSSLRIWCLLCMRPHTRRAFPPNAKHHNGQFWSLVNKPTFPSFMHIYVNQKYKSHREHPSVHRKPLIQ